MFDTVQLQELLRTVASDAAERLAGVTDRRREGERVGQYGLDLVVDEPLVRSLLAEGLGVLSEEAGLVDTDRKMLAVVDPVDGSTNASRLVPWCATSICVLDQEGPLVALVENLVTRERFEAVRGQGAWHDGEPITAPAAVDESERVVLVNGNPPADRPWAQFRCFGASALDICYVASGKVDGYVDFDDEAHGIWDYAAAMLVCAELDVPIVDAFGRDLLHREHSERRTPVVAHTQEVLDEFVSLRKAQRR